MRTMGWMGIAALSVTGVALWVAGCADGLDLADDCTFARTCCADGTLDCLNRGDGGTDGGDSGPLPSCIPSENSTPVADSCGVFVSSGTGSDTSGKGTQAAPYQTIKAGVGKANGKPVYACAGSTPFNEALAVPAGATIFGGLDCSSWSYVGATTKTTITAGVGQVPVTLSAGGGAKLADLHVLAADASAMSDGTSSIAMVANEATAELDGCVVEGQGGAAGAAGKGYTSPAMAGMTGLPGTDACMGVAAVLGANPVSSGCGTPDSTSGAGGEGLVATGGTGSPGSPGSAMNGGAGEGAGVCTPGTKGDDGLAGMPGTGITAAQLGTLSAGGYTGLPGTDGQPGPPGQGGGGGGGAKGGTGAGMCPVGMAAGASGGSGGSGGCGGAGGKGGKPGGSSIALVNLGATLTMSNVTITAGGGGKGGDGGQGQAGGNGGNQGSGGTATLPLNPGCSGGVGGGGGNGGQGGGGRGGHAIGIAYTGATAPSMTGVTFVKGTAGMGGSGDDSMGNMGDGAQGVVADVQGF